MDLRDGLVDFYRRAREEGKIHKSTPEGDADELMQHLSSRVVERVDRELPSREFYGDDGIAATFGYDEAISDIEDAGYVAVKPLRGKVHAL